MKLLLAIVLALQVASGSSPSISIDRADERACSSACAASHQGGVGSMCSTTVRAAGAGAACHADCDRCCEREAGRMCGCRANPVPERPAPPEPMAIESTRVAGELPGRDRHGLVRVLEQRVPVEGVRAVVRAPRVLMPRTDRLCVWRT